MVVWTLPGATGKIGEPAVLRVEAAWQCVTEASRHTTTTVANLCRVWKPTTSPAPVCHHALGTGTVRSLTGASGLCVPGPALACVSEVVTLRRSLPVEARHALACHSRRQHRATHKRLKLAPPSVVCKHVGIASWANGGCGVLALGPVAVGSGSANANLSASPKMVERPAAQSCRSQTPAPSFHVSLSAARTAAGAFGLIGGNAPSAEGSGHASVPSCRCQTTAAKCAIFRVPRKSPTAQAVARRQCSARGVTGQPPVTVALHVARRL
mmetsp:Transcript_123625/g.240480  ORF Transcript_123625/g.240480 Transcript_123625/m.240480 type:complete len:268 (-) Transcript_123625:2613-3416(-)